MTLQEFQSAYHAAVAAESTAKTAHDEAITSREAILLALSREGGDATDKRIITADAAIKATATALEMAGLARADAERAAHEAEVAWLTAEAARFKAAHTSAEEAAQSAATHARQALADAQLALDGWMTARGDAARASQAAALFDSSIAAYAATNPVLAAIPGPERPKTRLTGGGGVNRNLQIVLQTTTGIRQRPNVIG